MYSRLAPVPPPISTHRPFSGIGTAEYNQRLSERRANAVAAYLESKGVALNRMSVEGFGETKLAVPTPDQTYEPRNRRTEIRRR